MGIPVGTIIAYGGSKTSHPSDDWLYCDGNPASLHDFPKLFEAIGTIYGGSGNPYFNLPNLKGVFLRGTDDGSGKDPDSTTRYSQEDAKRIVGDTPGSRQDCALQDHHHTTTAINDANSEDAVAPPSTVPIIGAHGTYCLFGNSCTSWARDVLRVGGYTVPLWATSPRSLIWWGRLVNWL